MLSKKEIRKKMKNQMANLSYLEKKEKEMLIHKKLFERDEWKQASVIGVTISIGKEIDTYSIIEKAWQEKKTVVAPKCFPDERKLEFYKVTSFEDLEDSFYNLKEPILSRTAKIEPSIMDFILVPGLVFDCNGYRIGYGGGYFDRFLATQTSVTCSLCYSFQIVDEFPIDDHDIPVQLIICDNRTIAV